ncbi:MAG TPA: hypothetical protein VF192_15320 [Longimicrobiales bacterium]
MPKPHANRLRLRCVDVFEDQLVLRLDTENHHTPLSVPARAALRALGRAGVRSLERAGWRLAQVRATAGRVSVVARRC